MIASIIGFFCINKSNIREFFSNIAKTQLYESEVVVTKGALIKLSNGKIVQLAGIYIPLGGTNYKEELLEYVNELLMGKKVGVKTVAMPKSDYSSYPLVILYTESGVNVNERLLLEGKAFFDHGYYSGHNKYGQLESIAKINKEGFWSKSYFPKILFIANDDSMDIHLLSCPYFQKERKKHIIEYYFIPQQIHYRKFYAFNCPFCREDKTHKMDFIDYYYRWYKEKYLP